MTERISPIKEALDALVKTISDTTSAILAEANDHKRQMIELVAKTVRSRNHLDEMAAVVNEAINAMAEAVEPVELAVDRIDEVLEMIDLPQSNYETFEGYCSSCGKELTVLDDFDVDGDDMFCMECVEAFAEEEEEEPEDEYEYEDELVEA